MSTGMEKGAEKATTLIEYVGQKERAKTAPTSEDAKVSTSVIRAFTCTIVLPPVSMSDLNAPQLC